MPELPPRLSPLADGQISLAGLAIGERPGLSIVQVAARRGEAEATIAALASSLGIRPSTEPNLAIVGERASALWIAPGQWLLVSERMAEGELYGILRETAGGVAAVMDQSHGRCVLRIAGSQARALLAKGCPLDLHPRAFQVGQCAQTVIGQVAALLHLVDDEPSFDLYLPRGYARTFWEWLAESAAEFDDRPP